MSMWDLSENLLKASIAYQKAMFSYMANNKQPDEWNPDPLNVSQAFQHLADEIAKDPSKTIQFNAELIRKYLELYRNLFEKMLGHEIDDVISSETKDARFKDQLWNTHPIFNFIKQSYMLNSEWMKDMVHQADAKISHEEVRKIDFLVRSLIDTASPSNNLLTNPEVLKETFDTAGENLVRGANNLAADIAAAHGKARISTTDMDAFKVGVNLATTPGKVVYQNKLMQLIQYEPLTKTVYKTPLLIMPAWINKYYILDLQKKNSYVRWLLEQGYTVFMISWLNPNKTLGDVDFQDYMKMGPLSAITEIQKITGEKQISMMGYCLGGTLLAATLAYLKETSPKNNPIKHATFLTSLIDFEDAGDLCVFIDETQISQLESRMNQDGYLDGSEMAITFSLIRANDMIWSFVINNYLMGKDPFPFDILYWNSDSTRLPAKMHSYYLRNMYLNNSLIKPNGIKLFDTPIDLRDIDIPAYILSTREDHIAPWRATYKATEIYKGLTRFVLSASGHVAGVVNHPSKNKYSYWTNDKLPNNPDSWFEAAKETPGSWWLDWNKWASKLFGAKIPARKVEKGLENAPGSYVKARLDEMD